MARQPSLPPNLLNRSLRVIRPKDAARQYAFPAGEFRRMAESGTLVRLAHGYYAIPPEGWLGNPGWRPQIEAVALGIAQVDHGPLATALCHLSAARILRAVPRALATGMVSVPVRRRPLDTTVGKVVFRERDLDGIRVQRATTELAEGWVTTAEQTLIDIADDPTRGGFTARTASEAIWSLAPTCDWQETATLATAQGKKAAYARARWSSAAVIGSDAPIFKLTHPVRAKGLVPFEPTAPDRFSIRDVER